VSKFSSRPSHLSHRTSTHCRPLDLVDHVLNLFRWIETICGFVDLFRWICSVYELVDTCGVYEHVDVIYMYYLLLHIYIPRVFHTQGMEYYSIPGPTHAPRAVPPAARSPATNLFFWSGPTNPLWYLIYFFARPSLPSSIFFRSDHNTYGARQLDDEHHIFYLK
jgi:hypothetical protein